MRELDTKRLLCPMPVIRLQQLITTLAPGDQVRMIATDPGVKADVPAWCRIHGHSVVELDDQNDEIIILVEVGSQS